MIKYQVRMFPQEPISKSSKFLTSIRGREGKMTRGSEAGNSVTARKPIAHTKSERKKQMKVVSQQEALEDDIDSGQV